jgi:hypothetical protein
VERVFVAPTAAEADQVARLLDDAGIRYEERLDASLHDTSSRICFLGTVFEVNVEEAEACRRLLTDHGLGRGVLY